ncbi:sugar transferase, partial [Arenicella sp.]|nr:sugar transferase [Arenicella sp.]
RPHAVAHNEFYRKKVSGYMARHKIRPGITGWAQVNGSRGETAQISDMERRIQYDLEYIRNWSILLDIRILLMTLKTISNFRDTY